MYNIENTMDANKEVDAVRNFAIEMVKLASDEGRKFRAQYGREPTEQEARKNFGIK